MKSNEKINVIITDDSPVFVEGMVYLLSLNKQFNVLDTCTNGSELVNNEQLSSTDLLLIDLAMPIMNGFEAAINIRDRFPDITMVAVTMQTEQDHIADIICSGFNGYVHKPRVPIQLLDVIEKAMNGNYDFQTI